jgi:hypothetical protein
MRRAHCEVIDPQEILKILAATHVGRLATVDSDGYPYITPLNFVYHEGAVYFHSAPEGEKLANLERNPKVCFEVDIPLAYLGVSFDPGRSPCRAHQLYHAVIIRGRARIVHDPELKAAALNALTAKHEGGGDFEPISQDASGYHGCVVVEIRPERTTGKSDLLQNRSDAFRRRIVDQLEKRGMPGDLEAVRAMGFKPMSPEKRA